ncbi:MAG: PepSY-like domain-containing protein [Ignavibacteriales bacterium]|nr:PepSY-like domain-containing protein [Ignavibacteriales bacterium]MCB9219908.1 PepSY-like domain-containing protein [Ignavibacteriales bacterium]
MKTKLLLLFTLLFALSLLAQETKVPKKVKDSFVKLYPNAKDVKWDQEGDEEFEASFKNGTEQISVVFDEDGRVEETETVIEVKNLSKPILDFVAQNYSDYKITETAKIVDDKGIVTFEAEVTKGKEKKDLIFDANGKQVKKEAKESDEKDED